MEVGDVIQCCKNKEPPKQHNTFAGIWEHVTRPQIADHPYTRRKSHYISMTGAVGEALPTAASHHRRTLRSTERIVAVGWPAIP